MKISFLGQGLEIESVNAVGNHLITFLSLKGFDSFTAISAFASEAGIYGLTKCINTAKKNFKNLNFIVGIDLGGTSKEALEEIMELNINSYVFFQKEPPIFHPKIYLIEGAKETKIIIGSSNLTSSGLFTNIECSVLIEFYSNDKDGVSFLSELKGYYKSLLDFSDPNLFKITNDLIKELFNLGILPNETTRRSYFSKNEIVPNAFESEKKTTISIPKRSTSKLPSTFLKRPTTKLIHTVKTKIVQVLPPINQKKLVWQKLSLSNSDAQNVSVGTAITGNLKLSQARFEINNEKIDQTNYFRNEIFKDLIWVNTKPNNNSYEEATCSFEITLLGNSIGTFNLKLSHDPIRIADQGNTPTWLHWGSEMLTFIQQANITGKTLNLYKSNQIFSLEIV